jgi:lysophospholipase L1-like esterase
VEFRGRQAFGLYLLPLLVLLNPLPATAEAVAKCTAPSDLARVDQALPRTSQRLLAGEPLTIVAIGSSSTAGAGASSSTASYPSRLEAELKERFANVAIKVVNRGVNGEEVADMLARFDAAVIAEKPDLVLWQLGTNSLLRDRGIEGAESRIREGVEKLKATGADIVLIDPQFAPKVIAKPEAEAMVSLISAAAKAVNVGLFHRFAVMRHWQQDEQIAFERFLSPDGLHMNDWSYACLAKLLAGGIVDAAKRATTVAGRGAGSLAGGSNGLPTGAGSDVIKVAAPPGSR